MPTSAKTLVFHIGDHKTGSTSIQYAFAQNRVTFPDASVHFSRGMNHSYLRARCDAFARPETDGMPLKARKERDKSINAFRKLANKVRDVPDPFSLVSAESLERVDPAVFHRVVTQFFDPKVAKIRVVAYVRPHASRLISNFTELIKIGNFDGNLADYFEHTLAQKRFFYLPRFQAWRDLFGDRFILRPMIREQLLDKSVLHDFIRHGFDQQDFQVEGTDLANPSLCLEDLMRLKVLQSYHQHQPQKVRHALGWEFARLISAMGPAEIRTKPTLDKSLADKIRATYLEDARDMDEVFFNGVPLLENELNTAFVGAADTPQSSDPTDWLSSSEIRGLNLLSQLITEMEENDADGWAPFWRSKRISALHPEATSGRGQSHKRGA